jgi:hypothetical protein
MLAGFAAVTLAQGPPFPPPGGPPFPPPSEPPFPPPGGPPANPEIDPGFVGGALAVLILGLLILTDRARRRQPTVGRQVPTSSTT